MNDNVEKNETILVLFCLKKIENYTRIKKECML